MTAYQWVTIGLIVLGNVITLAFGSFKLGRAVEQMKDALKDHFNTELEELRNEFLASQKTQDHQFGEVGAAMRQYTADVEKKVREVEIWGRDHFVQKSEFERATDTIRQDIKDMSQSIKDDFKDLHTKIDGKQ